MFALDREKSLAFNIPLISNLVNCLHASLVSIILFCFSQFGASPAAAQEESSEIFYGWVEQWQIYGIRQSGQSRTCTIVQWYRDRQIPFEFRIVALDQGSTGALGMSIRIETDFGVYDPDVKSAKVLRSGNEIFEIEYYHYTFRPNRRNVHTYYVWSDEGYISRERALVLLEALSSGNELIGGGMAFSLSNLSAAIASDEFARCIDDQFSDGEKYIFGFSQFPFPLPYKGNTLDDLPTLGGVAQVDSLRLEDGRVVLNGPIGEGFDDGLRQIFETRIIEGLTVENSPGCLLSEAMSAGQFLREKGVDILVTGDCASACVALVAGGTTRTAGLEARFGIHQSWWLGRGIAFVI